MRCMTEPELTLWQSDPHVSIAKVSVCFDCTAEYHREQKALGLCDGEPGRAKPVREYCGAPMRYGQTCARYAGHAFGRGHGHRSRWAVGYDRAAKRASTTPESVGQYDRQARLVGSAGVGLR